MFSQKNPLWNFLNILNIAVGTARNSARHHLSRKLRIVTWPTLFAGRWRAVEAMARSTDLAFLEAVRLMLAPVKSLAFCTAVVDTLTACTNWSIFLARWWQCSQFESVELVVQVCLCEYRQLLCLVHCVWYQLNCFVHLLVGNANVYKINAYV